MRSEWYFDFISPYAYLQHACFDALPAELEIVYRPVLFAGLLNHWGQLGPAEIPSKRRFTYRHALWLAETHGIEIGLPAGHPFNPLPLLRLALLCGDDRGAIHKIFRFVWVEGRRADRAEDLGALAAELGLADHARRIASPEVKRALSENGERAVACGVFGVPTFVLDGELYWGFDATPMLVDRLDEAPLFASERMHRIDELPVLANRIRRAT